MRLTLAHSLTVAHRYTGACAPLVTAQSSYSSMLVLLFHCHGDCQPSRSFFARRSFTVGFRLAPRLVEPPWSPLLAAAPAWDDHVSVRRPQAMHTSLTFPGTPGADSGAIC